MRAILITTCLFLVGCAYTHEPTMTSAPENVEQYKDDLTMCRSMAFHRSRAADERHKKSLTSDQIMAKEAMGFLGGAFGGYLAASAQAPSPEDNPDYFKNVPQMTDECMLNRGYPVILEK